MTDLTIVNENYSPGYYVGGYADDPYSSGTIAGVGKIEVAVEGELAQRVRARVGAAEDAVVTIIEDHWDIGYCVTCSSEEVDFEVQVNGEKVFRTAYLGYGEYTGDLSKVEEFVNGYEQFNRWLNREPLDTSYVFAAE